AAGRAVILSDITIADGTGSGEIHGIAAGGGLFNDSATVTLNRVAVMRNSVQGMGGGIFNLQGAVTVNASTVSDTGSGGGLVNGFVGFLATMTLNDTTVVRNTGVGVGNDGTMILRRCLITENTGVGIGGVGNTGTLTMTACTVTRNTGP